MPLAGSRTFGKTCAGTAVYSAHFGLFVQSDSATWSLNLREWADKPDASAWQLRAAMNTPRPRSASLCAIGAGAAQKLFVCSGGDHGKSEVYSPLEDMWTPVRARVRQQPFVSESGIHYCARLQRVYVAGGLGTEQQVAYYDVRRNAWIELPATSLPHSSYPALWCNQQAGGEQVLYITGDDNGGFGSTEWLDLREASTQWRVAARCEQLTTYIKSPTDFPKKRTWEGEGENLLQIRRTFV